MQVGGLTDNSVHMSRNHNISNIVICDKYNINYDFEPLSNIVIELCVNK